MEFLKLLESIRNPVLDMIMSVITYAGDEIVFLAFAVTIFWCVDKYFGYYILTVGFLGTLINQFLKLWFRIPRPWVLDKEFTIVESARAGAGGYSFPSGHTQGAVGTFGGAAYYNKKWKSFCIICVILAVLVPLSRMYLGVHTLKDVGVSVLIALVLIFAFKPIIDRIREKPHLMYILIFVMLALAVAFLLFVEFYAFPADLDIHNYESGVKSAYTLLGALLAFLPVYYLDEKYIHFQTKAPLKYQFLKVIIGFVLLILIRSGLKSLFGFIHFTHPVADSVRYFLVVFFAGTVYPLLFTKILSKKGV